MTDLHCHILPGIDDGAQTAADSLQLLRMEKENGVENIALTSHFNYERTTVEAFTEKRQRAYETLQQALQSEPMEFQFKLGAEVFFSPGLCEVDPRPLCMGDTAYMLIEMPTTHRPHFIRETFSQLQSQGILPLVAHVERYPYVMSDPTLLYDWVAAGAYAQVNATALLKGGKTARQLLQFIRWDLVHVLSTDAHSVDKRPPKMRQALDLVAEKLGAQAAQALEENGDELFCDQEPLVGSPHQPKKVFGRWV